MSNGNDDPVFHDVADLPPRVRQRDDEDDGRGGYLYLPGSVLVADRAVESVARKLRSRDGFRVGRRVVGGARGLTLWEAPDEEAGDRVPEIVDRLLDEDLRWSPPQGPPPVTPNHVVFGTSHLAFGPSSPVVPTSTRLTSAGGDDVGEGIRIAVFDSGLDLKEGTDDPESDFFDGSLVGARSDADEEPDADSDGTLDTEAGHGTFIAGIIRQYAPAAQVQCFKVLSSDGFVDDASLAAALEDAAGFHIVNLSLGGPTARDSGLPALREKVIEMRARNPWLVVVAAAGNAGSDDRWYPAAYPDVIGVGALDVTCSRKPGWSNFGPWVDVWAHGDRVTSTFLHWPGTDDGADEDVFEGWAEWSGTSFATPVVAAAIAARASESNPSRAQTPRAVNQAALEVLAHPLRNVDGAGNVVVVQPTKFVTETG
jgi:subtilisin family serine protease